jgi:uncharacterized membrane protein required for colicin V production
MNDSSPFIGIIGTAAAFGLGELNHFVGIVAGCLTCTLVTIQLIRALSRKK